MHREKSCVGRAFAKGAIINAGQSHKALIGGLYVVKQVGRRAHPHSLGVYAVSDTQRPAAESFVDFRLPRPVGRGRHQTFRFIEIDVRFGRQGFEPDKQALARERDAASLPESGRAQESRFGEAERFFEKGRCRPGIAAICGIPDFRILKPRRGECDHDRLDELVRPQPRAPRRDAHHFGHDAVVPYPHLLHLVSHVDRGNARAFEVGDRLCRTVVGCVSGLRVVMCEGVRQVAGQHAVQTGGSHVSDSFRLAYNADIRVDSHIDQVIQIVQFAIAVQLIGAGVDDIALLDAQSRIHAVPAVIDAALDTRPAQALALLGSEVADELLRRRPGEVWYGHGTLALRRADVLVCHIRGRPHHLHAEPSGCPQRLVQVGDQCTHTLRGRHAPVVIPEIDDDNTRARRVDAHFLNQDLIGIWIAGFQVEFDGPRSS